MSKIIRIYDDTSVMLEDDGDITIMTRVRLPYNNGEVSRAIRLTKSDMRKILTQKLIKTIFENPDSPKVIQELLNR